MKKSMYLLSGVVIGVAIASSTPVLAATAKSIAAKINGTVSVAVNGEKVKLNAQPINHNNLNYLPVGEIGRALGLSVGYDKKSDTINITSPAISQSVGNDQSSQTTPEPPAKPGTEVEEVKTAKLGDSITKDGVTMTIEKVEYKEQEYIDSLLLGKGFKISYTLTNNSSTTLRPDDEFKYELVDSHKESEVNSLGHTIRLSNPNDLRPGESTSGFIYTQYSGDIEIVSVSYTPLKSNITTKKPIGIWETK